MRVGIIGLGSIGQRHRSNLFALGYEVVCYDTRPPWARTWDDFIETYPHAVLICTPASTHATVARQLLDAGYHGPLFVEKPLALSVEDAEVFTRWPHPTTMVGYNWRFNTELGAFASAVKGLPCAWLNCYTDMALWPGAGARGGDPMKECSHVIDSAMHLFGARDLSCATRVGNSIAMLFDPWVEVFLCWDLQGVHSFMVANNSSAIEPLKCVPSPQSIDDSYRHEITHFLDCAQRGVPTETPFADGIRVLDVIAQAEAMAKVRA